MAKLAGFFVWLKDRHPTDLVAKEFGQEPMTQLMKRRAEPGCPHDSFPAYRQTVIFLCPVLELGENKAEREEDAEKSHELDKREFEGREEDEYKIIVLTNSE